MAIVGLVTVARFGAFFKSVIDWDESLYALVARELLAGHLPYVTAWECRPPGLFMLFALAFKAFGTSVIAYRILADVAVSASAFVLFKLGNCFTDRGRAVGICAAVLYIALTCGNGGTATNCEILFAPLICAAMLIVLKGATKLEPIGYARSLLIGLLLGIALQIKETVIFEIAFIGALMITQWRTTPSRLVAVIGATLLPIIAGIAIYAYAGQLHLYLDANVFATLRRVEAQGLPPINPLRLIGDEMLELFPAPIFAVIAAYWAWRREEDRFTQKLIWIFLIWGAIAVLSIAVPHEYLGHQMLQLVPPLALLAGYALVRIVSGLRRRTLAFGLTLAVIFAVHASEWIAEAAVTAFHRYRLGEPDFNDETAALASVLKARMGPNHSLFVMNDQPVLYLLTGANLPTRYPYPSYLRERYFERVAGIDGASEVKRVLRARPHLIATSKWTEDVEPAVLDIETQAMRTDYALDYATPDGHMVYRLRR